VLRKNAGQLPDDRRREPAYKISGKSGEFGMGILVKHAGKYYEISDEVIARSGITKEEFERKLRKLEVKLTEQGETGLGQYDFLDLSGIEEE
jgi:hypothetical protein